jgi:hypothetical protein
MRSIICSAFIFSLVSGNAAAVSLTATPGTVQTGQPVTFVITSSFAATPGGCSLTMDYGDRTSKTGLSLGTPSGVTDALHLIQTDTHSYTSSGVFTVTAEIVGCPQVAPVGPNPVTTQVTVAGLAVSRLELAFLDGKGQAIVRRNEQGLRAKAFLSTSGSGLLQGYWEVDGRPFPPVEQYVTFGQIVSIETPVVPSLPTFNPGDHLLRFVLVSPAVPFKVPVLVYTVTPEEGRPILLKSPLPLALLPYAPTGFSWNSQPGAGYYELTFKAKDGQKIFSAVTKEPGYYLSELALLKYFSPSASYDWQVDAYDTDGLPAGSSQSDSFRFLTNH